MGKYTGLLICSDFDGTLSINQKVSKEDLEAIARFQQNGGMFTLATGRYPTILADLKIPLHCNAPMVCMNGAILYDMDRDQVLYEGTMSEEDTEPLERTFVGQRGINTLAVCPSEPWEVQLVDTADLNTFRQAIAKKPYKILLHVQSEYSDVLTEHAKQVLGSEYTVARSWVEGIELQRAYYDKGRTARRLSDILGADKLICVGNYENDLSMILEADMGVAVANANDELKTAADYVTASVYEGGIAKLIEHL